MSNDAIFKREHHNVDSAEPTEFQRDRQLADTLADALRHAKQRLDANPGYSHATSEARDLVDAALAQHKAQRNLSGEGQ